MYPPYFSVYTHLPQALFFIHKSMYTSFVIEIQGYKTKVDLNISFPHFAECMNNQSSGIHVTNDVTISVKSIIEK